MEINQISQLLKTISTGATQSTTGDAGSNFEALLSQLVNNSQDQTLNNNGTSIPSINTKDNKVNGLDSLSLQSQRAEQLQQMVTQQMMQIMTSQDAGGSSSIGDSSSDDSSDSLFPSTNSNNNMSQLLQTILQGQTNATATSSSLDNSSQVNTVLSKSNL